MARLFREPALLRGLRSADSAQAVKELVRRTEGLVFSPPTAASR
jgi:hypothetical protein